MIARLVLIAIAGAMLGGCNWKTVEGSIAGGTCKIFEAPRYAVAGKTPYDQDWIDGTVETGIGGCSWQRPAPRPAELDAAPGRKVATPAPKPKPRGLVARIRSHLPAAIAPAQAAPIDPPAPMPDVVPAAPLDLPPPMPRSLLDELLHPTR